MLSICFTGYRFVHGLYAHEYSSSSPLSNVFMLKAVTYTMLIILSPKLIKSILTMNIVLNTGVKFSFNYADAYAVSILSLRSINMYE